MTLFSVSVFVALLAAALASPVIKTHHNTTTLTDGSDDRLNANLLVDAMILVINTNIPTDTVPIPTVGLPYVSNCKLYGLAGGFERVGDASAAISLSKVVFTLSLKAKTELGVKCDYSIFRFDGVVKLRMKMAKAKVVITQPTLGTPHLDTFNLANPGFRLKITGMGLLGWKLSNSFFLVSGLVAPPVILVIENAIKTVFNNIL